MKKIPQYSKKKIKSKNPKLQQSAKTLHIGGKWRKRRRGRWRGRRGRRREGRSGRRKMRKERAGEEVEVCKEGDAKKEGAARRVGRGRRW